MEFSRPKHNTFTHARTQAAYCSGGMHLSMIGNLKKRDPICCIMVRLIDSLGAKSWFRITHSEHCYHVIFSIAFNIRFLSVDGKDQSRAHTHTRTWTRCDRNRSEGKKIVCLCSCSCSCWAVTNSIISETHTHCCRKTNTILMCLNYPDSMHSEHFGCIRRLISTGIKAERT